METDQHWFISDPALQGPFSTSQLEALWSSHQIHSLSQISHS